jgi:mannose-6-phosphate isomerase-like protein (cupin superfamily)
MATTQKKTTTKNKKKSVKRAREAVVLGPGAGRVYDLGHGSTAVFKADDAKYSISEWWLAPKTRGPGAHSHDEDDLFYVIEGTVRFRVADKSIDAKKGSFVLAPGGVVHDFENRTSKRAGFLNVSAPGGFEEDMNPISAWFRARSAKDARVTSRA